MQLVYTVIDIVLVFFWPSDSGWMATFLYWRFSDLIQDFCSFLQYSGSNRLLHFLTTHNRLKPWSSIHHCRAVSVWANGGVITFDSMEHIVSREPRNCGHKSERKSKKKIIATIWLDLPLQKHKKLLNCNNWRCQKDTVTLFFSVYPCIAPNSEAWIASSNRSEISSKIYN